MTASPVQLPPFYIPIEPAVHPLAEDADARAVIWSERFGFCPDTSQRARLARAGSGRLAGRLAPRATSPDSLQILADFVIWSTAFDDECDEGPLRKSPAQMAEVFSRILRCIDVPETPPHDDDRYAASLHDLRLRLDRHATPVQIARWVDAIRDYLLSEIWRAGNVARGVRPSLSDYAFFRMHAGGAMAYPVLASMVEGYEVPPAVAEDRHIRALTEIAVMVGSAYTDIIGYTKDHHITGDGNNLIDVIRSEKQCTADEAIHTAVTMLDRMTDLFLSLRDAVSQDTHAALGRYVTTLGAFIRSVVDWIVESERYLRPFSPDDPPAFQTAGWTDTSRSDTRAPLPIASISWWWTLTPSHWPG